MKVETARSRVVYIFSDEDGDSVFQGRKQRQYVSGLNVSPRLKVETVCFRTENEDSMFQG
jgi:hypothetical protein